MCKAKDAPAHGLLEFYHLGRDLRGFFPCYQSRGDSVLLTSMTLKCKSPWGPDIEGAGDGGDGGVTDGSFERRCSRLVVRGSGKL